MTAEPRRSRRLYRSVSASLLLLAAALSTTPARALDYLNLAVQPDRAVPAACFSFSSALPRGRAGALDPYVAVTPALDHSLQAQGKDLCLGGLQHGATYSVRLKAGLPGADGTSLPKDVTVAVRVPDRDPQLTFDKGKTLLPYTKGVGLPVRSVNVARAHIALYRLGERALADQIAADWYGQALNGYNLDQMVAHASKLWEGSLDIAEQRNRLTTTTIPIDEVVKTLQPGVYVAVASADGGKDDRDVEKATQWFTVSDIALTTVGTPNETLVVARSLRSAEPLRDVELRLVSRGNEVLAKLRTDADGRAVLAGALLRGENGDAPSLVTATDAVGSFTAIRLDAPGLDLSDLDIKGRTPPGANDAFLWTDRGVYRPGETIHLGALLRDGSARLIDPRLAGSVPLTLHVVRPDGIETEARPLALPAAGGGTADVALSNNSVSGTWRLWVGIGATAKGKVGEVTVSVQDFVPPRLEAKATLPDGRLDPADIPVDVAADYFYGSPGAELSGTVEATIQAAAEPFKGLGGFRFGLAEEPVLPKALKATDFTTDEHGRARVSVKAEEVPDTTTPLEAALRVQVNDVDGRAAAAEATRTLHTADRFIGLRQDFTSLGEGDTAKFTLALVDGDGKPLAGEGLKWDLVREDYSYNYFFRDGRWQSHETITDSRANGGEVALDGAGRATVSARVGSGRWRLAVYDASGRTASSLRFGAGWWAEGGADENRKPEVMPVAIDAHPPAGMVRARIEPAFASRVLVMLDTGSGLKQLRELEVPKGGATVDLAGADVPPAGAHLLAVAVSPAGAVIPRLPVRAVGLAFVPGSSAGRTLDVALAAPETIVPKTALAVDVAVGGAKPGEETFLTLAAVDEAVLGMTEFATPDPAEHFLGRRSSDIELRDVYNQLIDPAGNPGRLREGGDGGNVNLGGLDVKTFKTVALFSGPVRLDGDGHARVSVDVPDFSGRLRLMAVAWSGERFGHADRAVTVRPPLLAELTLPRVLAPGDSVRAKLMLTALSAPEGAYAVTLTATGALAVDQPDAGFPDLQHDKRRTVERTLTAAAAPGTGHLHLVAKAADGTVAAERDFEVPVRTPNAYATTRQVLQIGPGAKLTLDDALNRDGAGRELVPGTGRLQVTASTAPAIDVAGLLSELRRYPYGCAEQTISRAFPELFVARLGAEAPAATADAVTAQGAIARLSSLQAEDGSFGYWTSFDTGNAWLTAYAVDFMQHARTAGVNVPEAMERRATDWLAARFAAADAGPREVAGAAYAAVVLSRANRLDLSQLRYVAARVRGSLPSDVARLQLAAALSRAGERGLAADLINAPAVKRDPRLWLNDYGTRLRDQAMTLALAIEEKLAPPPALFARALDLSRATGGKMYLSTQEQAWLLRVAADLSGTAPLDAALDGKSNAPGATNLGGSLPLGRGAKSVLENRGREPLYVALATTGVPAGPQPPESNGFTVSREVFKLDGTKADLADLHQNDELVVVLSGQMKEPIQRKVLAVDLLPGGLEPETVGLSTSREEGQFAWLKDLTEPTFFALRDDRYLAGIDLGEGNDRFKFAYVVRAVSPGTFANPGPQVEDMYAPVFHARGPAGTLVVQPARAGVTGGAAGKPSKP